METLRARGWRRLEARLSTALLGLLVATLTVDSLLLLWTRQETSVARNLVLQMALLVGFWWWTTRRSGTLLNPPFVIVLATFFWHSSFLAGRYLHWNEIFEYSGSVLTYGEQFVPLAVALVSLCMTCTVVGSVFGFRQQMRWRFRRLRNAGRRGVGTMRPPRGSPAAALYAWVLFAGYLSLNVAYLLFEGASASSGDYLDQYLNPSGTVLYRFFQMTKFLGVPLIALVIATSRSRASFWLACAGALSLIFASALSGARTLPFLHGATLILAVDYFRRRIPLSAVALLGTAAAATSWIISEARELGGVGMALLTSEAIDRPISWWHILWNSGGSVRSVLRTVEFSQHSGLEYGLSFLHALVFVVPAPLISLVAPGWTIQPPSEWMIAQSSDVGLGHGLGYSLVAEVYLNFGVVGCLLFLLVGWVVSHQYFRFRLRRDLFAGLQSLSLTALLALHLRSDSVTYLRVLVWGAAAIWLGRQIDAAWRRRRRLRAANESGGSTEAANMLDHARPA